jgi:hypothetical protein
MATEVASFDLMVPINPVLMPKMFSRSLLTEPWSMTGYIKYLARRTSVSSIGQVKNLTTVSMSGEEPKSVTDILYVHGVHFKFFIPQEFHGLS